MDELPRTILLPICSAHLEIFTLSKFPDVSAHDNDSEAGASNSSSWGYSLRAAAARSAQVTSGSHQPRMHWFQVILPIICSLGISGNILNLIVLTRKRFCTPMGKLERSANLGLTALAFSDMMFCTAVIPHSFIPLVRDVKVVRQAQLFVLYYKAYGVSAINMFLMTSTWLIVALAVERYIVLFYPLKAKWLLSLKRTKLILVAIYFTSAVVTLPYFLNVTIRECMGLDGSQLYEISARWPSVTMNLPIRVYLVHVWPVIAVFIPLLALLICNVRLIQGLRRVPTTRRLKCPGQKIRDVNARITLTLIIIVATALILVTPSEILKVINPYKRWGARSGLVIAAVSNLLQSLNFAFNFVLYCAIDRNFRQICRGFVLGNTCKAKAGRPNAGTEVIFFYRQGTASSISYRVAHKSSVTSSSKASSKTDRDRMFL